MMYDQTLIDMGITLGEPFKGAKQHHLLICSHCGNSWTATPVSKVQAFKKYGFNGCPVCNQQRIHNRNSIVRAANIQKLKDRGLEILSDWDGTTGVGKQSAHIDVTVLNTNCGHTFTSRSKNLLNSGVVCPICAQVTKTSNINKWSKTNSEEWQKTATAWKIYKSKVTKLTSQNYKQYKHTINPENLLTGLAGIEGAYHIDHIVPIRYCYDHNIPADICAHPDNLQMLGWRENVGSRARLKNIIPNMLKEYIS